MRGRTDIVAEDGPETVALADLPRGEICALAVDDPMAFTRALEMAQERARASACCRGRRKISVRHLIEVHGDWQRSYTYELARKHGVQVRGWSRL
jgi:hypothetical protein